MCNWCNNIITIIGKDELIKEVFDKYKSENKVLDYAKIIPIPDDIVRHKEAEFLSSEEYKWRCDNWGVKWNMSKEAILTLENGKAELEFDSPNSTIIPIIKRLGELYPELTFNLNYDEGGLCFRGEFEMKEGVVSLDEYEEYGSDEL